MGILLMSAQLISSVMCKECKHTDMMHTAKVENGKVVRVHGFPVPTNELFCNCCECLFLECRDCGEQNELGSIICESCGSEIEE